MLYTLFSQHGQSSQKWYMDHTNCISILIGGLMLSKIISQSQLKEYLHKCISLT